MFSSQFYFQTRGQINVFLRQAAKVNALYILAVNKIIILIK